MASVPLRHVWVGLAAGACMLALAAARPVIAAPDNTLATVHLARATMANGEPLAAGTYMVRLTDDAVTPVAGESPDGERWVEFVQAGAVKGRELATVLTGPEVKQVAKEAPPAAGQTKVQMLAGNQYLRVWINKGGTNYLVHLSVSGK